MKTLKYTIWLMISLVIVMLLACGGGSSSSGSTPLSAGNIGISSDENVNIENYNRTVENYVDAVKGMMNEYENALSAVSAGYTKKVTVETISTEEAYAYQDHLIKAVPYMAKTMLYSRDLIRLENAIPSISQGAQKRVAFTTVLGLGSLALLGYKALTAGEKAINKINDKGLETIDNITLNSPEHKSVTKILKLDEDASIEEMKDAYNKLSLNDKTIANRDINTEMLGTENSKDRVKEGVVETAPEIAEIGVNLAVDASQAATGGFFDKVFSTFGVGEKASAILDFVLSYYGLDPTSIIKGSLAQTDKKTVSATFPNVNVPDTENPETAVETLNSVASGDFDNLTSEGLEMLSYIILEDMLDGLNVTKNADGSISGQIPESAFLINIKDVKNGDRLQVLNYEDFVLLLTIAENYPEFFDNLDTNNLTNNGITLELNPLNSEEEEEPSNTSSLYTKPTQAQCVSAGGDWNSIDECQVDWNEAMNICEMPSIEMWRDVVTGCGGVIGNITENENNDAYEQCYKELGLGKAAYWSSSTDATNSEDAWVVNLRNGYDFTHYKTYSHAYHVRCVK